MILLLLFVASLQSPVSLSGTVVDSSGAAIAQARVRIVTAAGAHLEQTGRDGAWTARAVDLAGVPPGVHVRVEISAAGFVPVSIDVVAGGPPLRTELQPRGIVERVTVSPPAAERLSLDASATTLDAQALASSPALTLDDQLRSTPGFSLFRRTSSRVANPTTQGVTLRGLSASGASRTLVLADGIPLNDPFGGWVYWDRIPQAALDRVDVVRGGSSDVHGDEALAGVIAIETRTSPGVDVRLEAGGEGTGRASAYGGGHWGAWRAGGAAEHFTTNGYVTIAPESRGPIDAPADSTSSSLLGWTQAQAGPTVATLRAGYFDEDRDNGTPLQVNATIIRSGSGSVHGAAFGGVWSVEGHVMRENYRQTFSAVNDARDAERLTSAQRIGTTSGGVSGQWVRAGGRATWLVGASGTQVRSNLDVQGYSFNGLPQPLSITPARQRHAGVTAEVAYDAGSRVTLDAGIRGEVATSRDLADPQSPSRDRFLAPRLTAAVALTADTTLRASWLSGFRAATINERYRPFRVGDVSTLANAALGPEKSRGPEVALTTTRGRWTGRAIGFATWLDGAVYSRTLSILPTLITRQRANGDARAMGLELETQARVGRGVSLTASIAAMDSRFTSGELDGLRIPQVPRVQAAAGATFARASWTGALNWRVIGAQFDDDVNRFRLGAAAPLDGRVAWRAWPGLEVFAALENVFDESIDTGRTPIRTIGQPRVARAGVVARW
ncbi:MAG TPA: TonB-dependent receptor [Vicinamibacterales bacterium]|nr:TonB-dependent receptor [Vicinamibacterales bacterium]